ncbi:hypothetical protein JDV02_003114 [Purpureocillium takamizusanense]|uniref:RING-type domain-containing protein n=1 Tax=Purpureocillium takamizusanense TaxID=2060973 RepID=A0A9Q8V852_9HYPO|nr:uncharacterized protein JDV02_003114 [Purpureocillium takamizusanense]UNI16700.1 hypothetical protein JDV02_003114 [Purpureocillium takamizusanense]
MCSIHQLVLNLGGAAEHLAVVNLTDCRLFASRGLQLRQAGWSTVVADCGERACGRLQQVHWRPSSTDQLYGRVLFPLSAAVVLFADRLGGIKAAASVTAGILRFSPIVDSVTPPSLLVLCRKETCSEDAFSHHLTTELLCALREAHPEESRSFSEVRQMWSSRVRHIRIITQPGSQCWPEVSQAAEQTSNIRYNEGYGLSGCQFRRLLCHAMEYFDQGSDDTFDILQALGVQNPVTDHARVYLGALLRQKQGTQEERIKVAASCLAFNAYRGNAYVSHPGTVVQALASRLLRTIVDDYDSIMGVLRHYFVKVVQQHMARESTIAEQHLTLMRTLRDKVPGCSLCLLRTPVHMLTCGHELCDHCAGALRECPKLERCRLCKAVNYSALPVSPNVAGPRALVVSGSAISAVRFLLKIRKLLFGHLEDYFDLIASSEPAAIVLAEYFGHQKSLQQCLELADTLQKRPTWFRRRAALPKSRARLLVLAGNRVHSNYGISSLDDGQRRQLLSRLRHAWHSDGESESFTRRIAQSETHTIWGRRGFLTIEHHRGAARLFSSGEIKTSAGKMFAALFFLRLQRARPTNTQLPIMLDLEVACRLPAGEHLNAVVHALLDHQVQLYWSLPSGRLPMRMCDRKSWIRAAKFDEPLRWGLRVESPSENTQIQVHIDNIYALGEKEEVGNSSRTVTDFLTEARDDSRKDGDSDPRVGPASCDAGAAYSHFEHSSSHIDDGAASSKGQLGQFGKSMKQLVDQDEESVVTEFDLDSQLVSSATCTQFSGLESELDDLGSELESILRQWD